MSILSDLSVATAGKVLANVETRQGFSQRRDLGRQRQASRSRGVVRAAAGAEGKRHSRTSLRLAGREPMGRRDVWGGFGAGLESRGPRKGSQAGRSPRDGGDLDTPQEWAAGRGVRKDVEVASVRDWSPAVPGKHGGPGRTALPGGRIYSTPGPGGCIWAGACRRGEPGWGPCRYAGKSNLNHTPQTWTLS